MKPTRAVPSCFVLRRIATVLIWPKPSSIRLRINEVAMNYLCSQRNHFEAPTQLS